MSQHDMNLDNQAGAAFRADLNSALGALVTLSSGASAPAVTYANMLWADTFTGFLKQRDNSNTAWISVYPLSGIQNILDPYLFAKADKSSSAFTKTGNGTASIKAGTILKVAQQVFSFTSNTAITMPTLTSGTDYAIYICSDGTVRADSNFTAPTGYTTLNSLRIGSFHYAPGGNATGTSGGNTTPQINENSFWDLKFKPACQDPRGMTLVAGSFCSDIYLLGQEHLSNGTSKYNVTIADGSSPPKVPTQFGGNGTSSYSDLNYCNAGEVMRSYGKRLPRYDEFAALAYGTTEASSVGTDQVSTILNSAYTSQCGVIQATGVMWIWGADFGGGAAASSWSANTGGRGSTYQMSNAVLFGSHWNEGANSGSRASFWNYSPTNSLSHIGARGVCDLLILD